MKTRDYKKKIRKNIGPKVIVFACNWGALNQDDQGEIAPKQRYPGINFIRIMCSGRLSPALIFRAFELGADGVLSLGCPEGECHYSFGEEAADNNFATAIKVVRLLGIGEGRLRMERPSGLEPERVEDIINSFVRELENLG